MSGEARAKEAALEYQECGNAEGRDRRGFDEAPHGQVGEADGHVDAYREEQETGLVGSQAVVAESQSERHQDYQRSSEAVHGMWPEAPPVGMSGQKATSLAHEHGGQQDFLPGREDQQCGAGDAEIGADDLGQEWVGREENQDPEQSQVRLGEADDDTADHQQDRPHQVERRDQESESQDGRHDTCEPGPMQDFVQFFPHSMGRKTATGRDRRAINLRYASPRATRGCAAGRR